MTGYILRRLGTVLLQIIGITALVFFLMRLLPADPAAQLVGANSSPEALAQARASLGLDRPVLMQFAGFVGLSFDPAAPGILQGSLGRSWLSSNSVAADLALFLPVTFELITYALIVALAVAVPVGMFGAIRPGGVCDRVSLVWGLFAGSQPEFWWGLMIVFVFFFVFQQAGLPHAPAPLGRLDPMLTEPARITGSIVIDALLQRQFAVAWDAAMHLMLPVLTLVFVISGPIVKMVRQSMARVLTSDYVLYARLAGLPRWRVGLYALRAALGPALTLIGFTYGFLLGGAVPVEVIFSLNGLGEYAVRSVTQLDFPAIQGAVLTISCVSLLIYLLVDCMQVALDPRVRP